MNIDQALETVEQALLSRPLSPIERLILRQSLIGRTYGEMAQDSGYGSVYIKEVGSQLWHDLSKALGERVTKKNLHLVLHQHQQTRSGTPGTEASQEFQKDTEAQYYSPSLIINEEREFPGSPVPLNSTRYINRPPIEELAYAEINKPGCVIRIKAPSKMGKSSLLNRIVACAKAQDYKVVSIDFQEADESIFSSLDQFLRWFCANISRKLNLNPRLDDYWDEDMGSKVSCKIYFEGYLLESLDRPLVLTLNEVNRIFEHPNIAQDFFPMLRFWHEQAQQVETWQKLRLVIVHTTEIYIPLKIHQSPFNVGLSLKLPQFSSKQVQDLAGRYGLDWKDGSEIQQLMAMVGGHPYLVNLALYHLSQGEMTLEELLQSASTQAGIYSHHLRGHWAMLRDEPELASVLKQVVTADESVQLDAIAAYKLESMGLVELEGNQAKPSCELYRIYFRQQLKEQNWLDAREQLLEDEQEELQEADNFDELTQLPNDLYFNQYLETEWQHWSEEIIEVSLIFCEIDYFKYYNDAHGYRTGDNTLKQIAKTIGNCAIEQAVLLARYEGTKFAVLLTQINADTAVEIAEQMRQSIKKLAIAYNLPNISGFPDEVLTASLGVATVTPSSKTSPTMLIAAAEGALYQSKRQGRDCVTLNSTLTVGC